MPTLADALGARAREGALWEREDGARVRCVACGHRCAIASGAAGVCQVRFNKDGRLLVPWGYVAGAHADPIEKKPFYHVLPGSVAFSFGMLGCDFHCSFCQNWLTSQALRDPDAGTGVVDITPDRLVARALASGAAAVVSTYNEPLITAEWAAAVFEPARRAGLLTGFVSNGHGTPEALNFLAPVTDLFKVDLKGFDDRRYRELGGRLQPVLDTIQRLHDLGLWVEIVTLLVPGFNDGEEELRRLAGFVREVSPDIPWHVTAFHADYRMTARHATGADLLLRAAAIGRRCGLKFVYAGNLPGLVGDFEDTACPSCNARLVERRGFRVGSSRVTGAGTCPDCQAPVPGRWSRPVAPTRGTTRA